MSAFAPPNELTLNDLGDDGRVLDPLAVAILDGDEDAQWNALALKGKEPFLELPVREGSCLEVVEPNYRKAKVLKVQRLSCIVECRVMVNDILWPEHAQRPKDNWIEEVWQEVWAVREERYAHPKHPQQIVVERHCFVTQENRPKARRESSVAVKTKIKAVLDENPNRYWRVPADAQPRGEADPDRDAKELIEREPETAAQVAERLAGRHATAEPEAQEGAGHAEAAPVENDKSQDPPTKRKRGRPRKSS